MFWLAVVKLIELIVFRLIALTLQQFKKKKRDINFKFKQCCRSIEEGIIQKRRSSLRLGGQNWLNSLARLLFCTSTIWRIGWNYPVLGWNHPILGRTNPSLPIVLHGAKLASAERNWINSEFCPPSRSDDLCLLFCIYLSSSMIGSLGGSAGTIRPKPRQ